MSDLAQTYNDSEDVPVSWNEPTFCAVHAAAPGEEKCWYRGKITQTLSETKFQVGYISCVPSVLKEISLIPYYKLIRQQKK